MPGESGKRVKIAVVWGSSEMEKIGQNAIRLDEMENGKKRSPPDLCGTAGRGEANASIVVPGLRSGTDNVSVVTFRESCFEDYFGRTFSLLMKSARSPPSPNPSLP